jgi:hypothetical protein
MSARIKYKQYPKVCARNISRFHASCCQRMGVDIGLVLTRVRMYSM